MQYKNFISKVAAVCQNRFFIIESIIIAAFLTIYLGGPGFIFGIALALITLWSGGWDWAYFGFNRTNYREAIHTALFYTLWIILLNDIILDPLLFAITQKTVDISALDGIKGNILTYMIFLLFMWIVAAFGEEFFYRGYIMKRIAVLLGDTNKSWIVALFINVFLFAFVHAYQGMIGIISTGFVGLILSIAFYRNRTKLLIPILIHGFYDSYGITLIYLDKANYLKGIFTEIYSNIIY